MRSAESGRRVVHQFVCWSTFDPHVSRWTRILPICGPAWLSIGGTIAQADRVPVGPLAGYANVLERCAEQLVHPFVALEAGLQLVDGAGLADQPLRKARDLPERRHVLEDEQTAAVNQVAAPLFVERTRDRVNRNAHADGVVANG